MRACRGLFVSDANRPIAEFLGDCLQAEKKRFASRFLGFQLGFRPCIASLKGCRFSESGRSQRAGGRELRGRHLAVKQERASLAASVGIALRSAKKPPGRSLEVNLAFMP